MKLEQKRGNLSTWYHASYISALWKEGYEIGYQGSEAHEGQDLKSHVVLAPSLHQVRNSGLQTPRILLGDLEMSFGFCHSVNGHCPREILPLSLAFIL